MKHLKFNINALPRLLILLVALLVSNPPYLESSPPIDILDHREVVIEKAERKVGKKRWKKELRQKHKKQKTTRKKSRPRKFWRTLFEVLIIFGMVLGVIAIAGLTAWTIGWGGDASILLSGIGALIYILLGLWGLAKINRNNTRFWWIIELILIGIATLGLFAFTILLFLIIPTPLSDIILSLVAAAVLFFGPWLFIRVLRR